MHTVRHDLTEFGVDEVTYLDLLGAAFRPVVAADVRAGTDRLFLLRVNRDDRFAGGLHGEQRGGVVRVLQPAAGGTSCDPCRLRRRGDTAIARRSRFRRHEQPACPLIQAATNRGKPLADRCCVDHVPILTATRPRRNPPRSHSPLCSPHPIRSLLGVA